MCTPHPKTNTAQSNPAGKHETTTTSRHTATPCNQAPRTSDTIDAAKDKYGTARP